MLLTANALEAGASSLALHENKRWQESRLFELRDRLEKRMQEEDIYCEVERARRRLLDAWEDVKLITANDEKEEGGAAGRNAQAY